MDGIELLDCTLRDASYPISYQFTAEDTAVIAAALEDAGFRTIEVGHGMGVGASSPRFGQAAASDADYLAAAGSVLKEAAFGAFSIAGIATLDDMRLVAKHGASFIRIGTNATETEEAESYVKLSKDLGLRVSANLMKTYVLPLDDVIRRAEQLAAWGADVICVVDSAGGMLPADIASYVSALTGAIDVQVGFHGHNNLQLALANTVAAVEAGATVVDSTIRGLGRSSGNAQTEALVLVLKRMGIDLGIDLIKMMDISDKLIGPMAQGRGVDSLELAAGYALFHSSFMPIVDKVAEELGVDARELIIGVSARDKVNVTEALAREVAQGQQRVRDESDAPMHRSFEWDLQPKRREGTPGSLAGEARDIAEEIRTIAKKSGRRSLFTIARSPASATTGAPTFPFVRTSELYVIGNAEVATEAQAAEIAAAIDGTIDDIVVDAGPGLLVAVRDAVTESRVLSYRDDEAQLDAAEALVAALIPVLESARVAVCGADSLGARLASRLVERGAAVLLWDPDGDAATRVVGALRVLAPASGSIDLLELNTSDLDAVVGARQRGAVIGPDLVACVRPGGILLDAGVGSVTSEAVAAADERGVEVHRLDMRAGLTGQLTTAVETDRLVRQVSGRGEVAGIPVVAGGIVGVAGTVVVDAIQDPTRVLGVADGAGRLLSDADAEPHTDRVAAVRSALIRRRLP